MTDVTVAAPSGGAPSAAPNEVVINPQTTTPTPVGPQAPDKPVGDIEGSKHRPASRREQIQQAFDRATKQQEEGAQRQPRQTRDAKAPEAEAKPGHNKPPEETKPERPQPHREQGRFARPPDAQAQQTAHDTGRQPGQAPANGQANGQANALPEGTPYREPPGRFAEHAKAEWSRAPESVRGEVHRMASEFQGAYQRFRGDHEAMNSIRPFHEMATKHGTTLERALTNYVSMEQKLREDVVGGLDVIVRNLNLKGPDGERIGLRDVAYHILNMSPDQHRLTQAQNAQVATTHQIGELHQEVAGLKNHLEQMHTAQQFSYTRSAVDQFADQHPRFDELSDLIELELKFGFPLDQAYRRAELLRPTTHAAQTRTPSAQTRQADKSISGAPDGGPSNGSARSQRSGDRPIGRRETIGRAIQRAKGSL